MQILIPVNMSKSKPNIAFKIHVNNQYNTLTPPPPPTPESHHPYKHHKCKQITVELVLKDHPVVHKNVVCQDRWSLVTGSVILNCRSFCQKCMVCHCVPWQWAVVSQDRFHCTCTDTVEPLLKECPIGHKTVVSQDRWSLVTGWSLYGPSVRETTCLQKWQCHCFSEIRCRYTTWPVTRDHLCWKTTVFQL